MLNEKFVIVGSLIGTAGAFVYLWNTIKGRVRPNRVSYLLWAVIPMIAFAAQVKQGVGLESLMTFCTGFLPFIILVASFFNKKAEWKITRFDLVCGFFSVLGLILWILTDVGNVAILFSIVADALAALPTLVKAYKHPETEMAWPWIATCAGVVLTLLTLDEWTFANSSFIIYIFIVNLMIFSCVQFGLGKRLKSSHPEV